MAMIEKKEPEEAHCLLPTFLRSGHTSTCLGFSGPNISTRDREMGRRSFVSTVIPATVLPLCFCKLDRPRPAWSPFLGDSSKAGPATC